MRSGPAWLGIVLLTACPAPRKAAPVSLAVVAETPPEAPTPSKLDDGPPPKLGPFTFDPGLDRYTAARGEHLAVLSLHPQLHDRLDEVLEQGQVLWGAAVVVELGTGRVLAMAEHSEREPGLRVATRPVGPAASVFKVVSTAALLRAGAPLDREKVCYGRSGRRRLQPKHLLPSRYDRRCLFGRDVLAYSANVAMARLADAWLDAERLHQEARRFGFGRVLLDEIEYQPSLVLMEDERFDVAKTAAGFGDVRLGVLHAATLAAVFAQDGELVRPTLIDAVSAGPEPKHPRPERVIDVETAQAVAVMLKDTVRKGTGRSYRHLKRGAPRPAGKTGSLMDYVKHVDHSWFVGFAPADEPRIAFAVGIVNDWNLWHVKAKQVSRKLLEIYGEETREHPAGFEPQVPTLF